jgi:F-type H+-transporting ATPase subunit b
MPLLETHNYIPQLFWLVISFALLYFLLSKFCIPQLTGIFQLREDKINNALAEARTMQEEAVKLKADYEEKLKSAIQTRDEMITKAMHELSLEIEKKNAEQDLNFEKMLQIAEKNLQDFEKNSISSVDNIAKEAAKDILKDFLKISTSDELISKEIKNAREA